MGPVDLSSGVHMAAPTTGVPTASVLLAPPQLAPMNTLMHAHAGMPVTMQHMVSAAGQVPPECLQPACMTRSGD